MTLSVPTWMARGILATPGECAYEHTVPTDAQKILLDFALFCTTRETKALSDVVAKFAMLSPS